MGFKKKEKQTWAKTLLHWRGMFTDSDVEGDCGAVRGAYGWGGYGGTGSGEEGVSGSGEGGKLCYGMGESSARGIWTESESARSWNPSPP